MNYGGIQTDKMLNTTENLWTKTFLAAVNNSQFLDFLVYWGWELAPTENEVNCMFGIQTGIKGRE